MASTPTRLMTFAEFERLPDPPPGIRYELHHGELVKLAPPLQKHVRAQWQLRRLLERLAGDAVVVHTEASFRALPNYEFRIADVVFVSKERWDSADPDGYLMGAPELVIEILSPSNTSSEIMDRERLCLQNGSVEFWVVDLECQQVKVSTPDGHTITYKTGSDIPLFFGGNIAVDAIFI